MIAGHGTEARLDARRPARDLEHFRAIAAHQRFANLALLTQSVMFGFALLPPLPEQLGAVFQVIAAVLGFGALVAAVQLIDALYNSVVAALCAPLLLIPALSLLVAMVFSVLANRRLRAAGFTTPFLGAHPDDLR